MNLDMQKLLSGVAGFLQRFALSAGCLLFLALPWITATALAPAALAQTTATIQIQADRPLHKVSPTLYGLMTEEINYSYDGGLYAEMVRNRTFEPTWSGMDHWVMVEQGSGRGELRSLSSDGPSVDVPHSAQLQVTTADEQNRVGFRNEGYWGMAVRPDTAYTGSFFAKTVKGGVASVTVTLVSDASGKPVASATVGPLTREWKRYDFVLQTEKLTPSLLHHLEVTLQQPATVNFQLVSLFPPTYKNRLNGNRVDLMEMLAAMHPHFLRLPGGNYLEGDTPEERFDWKATLGPLQNRSTHRSPWGYQSTDGMGLLEFLEWTEDLHLDPVLAVYAGYSLKGVHVSPGSPLKSYVDEALDEIEFVTGDTHTKWGAIRAQLGHPLPFPLRYVEIGNEDDLDRSGSYDGRFTQFYRAIKAAYPQLEIIATTPVKTVRPDVIDDHYYRHANEFYSMLHKYDTADRNGPKIFIGEWATIEGSPTTTLGAMLGDAALMTSMERNSDLIVMASYAPLFVNVNPGGMQWEHNLIGYDAMSSYGAPSYYAQALFAEFLGNEVPASTKTGGSDRFFYSVTRDVAKGKLYLKLVNATSTPQPLTLQIDGDSKLAKEASVETIGGNDPAETNSIMDPHHIAPIHGTLRSVSPTMQHTVPAYSVQVLSFSM